MFVRVTAEDIEDGIKGKSDSCPLALALQRRTGTPAYVNCHNFRYKKATGWTYRSLSNSGRTFVRDFDRGQRVRPGIYWI